MIKSNHENADYLGKYRPVGCEWKGSNSHNCNSSVVRGWAYCEEHLRAAYKQVPEHYFDDEARVATVKLKQIDNKATVEDDYDPDME